MPVDAPTAERPALAAVGAEPDDGHEPPLRLALLGAVLTASIAHAAGRSGASAARWGQVLGRLDLASGVVVVVVAAATAAVVMGRALDGRPPIRAVDAGRTLLRVVLLPWWVAVTVATFLYPTAPGEVVPSDAAAPAWTDVVRDWLLLGWARRGGTGRLPVDWILAAVVADVVVAVAVGPVLDRIADRTRTRTAVAGSAGLLVVGLAVRVVTADAAVDGWASLLRISPAGHLDLIGGGLLVGVLVAAARRGRGPLTGRLDVVAAGAPRVGAVVALALLAGLAGPGSATVVGVTGAVPSLLSGLGVVVVGVTVAVVALAGRRPRLDPGSVVGPGAWVAALAAAPLAAQLWATRAGGPPGTQRLGPIVIVTVLGAFGVAAGWGAAASGLFDRDGRRRLTRFSSALATVTGLALAWRLLTLVSINRRNPDGGDPFFYHHQANMLADRIGFSEPFRWIEQGLAVPSAIHPPLLSTWLAVGSVAGARTFLAHKTLAALVGVGSVVVAALVARRIAGDRAALVTAVLVAAYPNLWVIDGALWPEGVYTTFVGLVVLAAYRWWERPDLLRAGVLGGAIAVAALARGEAVFLFPLLVAPLFLMRRGPALSRRVLAGAVAGVVALVVVAPWMVRSYRAFDQVVMLSTNGDEVLFYANCPDSYGLPDDRPVPEGAPEPNVDFLGYWSFNCQQRERARAGEPVSSREADTYRACLGPGQPFDGTAPGEPIGNEAEKAKYWRCLALRYASDHVDRLPVVVVTRIGRELDIYRPDQGLLFLEVEGRPRTAARIGQIGWWAMAPIGVAGWVVLRRRGVLVYPLVALGLMVLVTTVYAYGAVRFRTPLELALLIGEGVAVDAAWARWRPATATAEERA